MKIKMRLLQTLIEEEWPDRCIIFANTKQRCEDIWGHLVADGHRVGLLTGDVAQRKRIQILDARSKMDLIILREEAARGLHIPKVTHVFNYDLPEDVENYIHRIGRTGRAGEKGYSISLACEAFASHLSAIEAYTGHRIPTSEYNKEALLTDFPQPKRLQRHHRRYAGSRNQGASRNTRSPR